MDFSLLGKSIVVFLLGITARWVAVFAVTSMECGKFDTKEKMFMAFSWIPKATVQAALSYSVLSLTAKMTNLSDADREEAEKYG